MKGINKQRHEVLKQSLQQLKALLSAQVCGFEQHEDGCNTSGDGTVAIIQQNIVNVQNALEAIEQSYQQYQHLLDQLSFHIADYEDLYSEVKVNCLGSNLRQLLRDLPKQSVDSVVLQESINMAKTV